MGEVLGNRLLVTSVDLLVYRRMDGETPSVAAILGTEFGAAVCGELVSWKHVYRDY
jgi:hypothetical protein